jgi:selenocysteine-specific elongation factor
MPQTREHLAVLSLLGIRQGAVIITKCDRADATQIERATLQIQELLGLTPLALAPILTASAQTGQGLEALQNWLAETAAQLPAHPAQHKAFRLAVDRAFTLDGSGTVVTGTVHAGSVQVGDVLQLAPGHLQARVRSIHAQNRTTTTAHAGQRCALALVGIGKDAIARGQWLVQPDIALQTERIDTVLQVWQGEAQALRSGTSVHIHIGAASVMGTVAVLENDFVQLVLRDPIAAWHGDRVVLRDASASRTIAGGIVLDPFAPVRYRRTPQRMKELAELLDSDGCGRGESLESTRLAALLEVSPNGVDVQRFHVAAGDSRLSPLAHGGQGTWAIAPQHAEIAATHILATLATYHQKHPEELGPDAARLRRLALPRWAEALWQTVLADLRSQHKIVLRGACVHLPEHGLKLSATEERIAQKVASDLIAAQYDGAWVRDLAKNAAEPEALVRVTLARLAQRGDLYQVVKDLYYPPATVADCAAKVRTIAATNGGTVLAAQFRDATGLGRKRAIQILEFFDRIGLLRRVGDAHKLRSDCQLFTDGAA